MVSLFSFLKSVTSPTYHSVYLPLAFYTLLMAILIQSKALTPWISQLRDNSCVLKGQQYLNNNNHN